VPADDMAAAGIARGEAQYEVVGADAPPQQAAARRFQFPSLTRQQPSATRSDELKIADHLRRRPRQLPSPLHLAASAPRRHRGKKQRPAALRPCQCHRAP